MDRFIANPRTKMITEGKYLKSNMDRFIGVAGYEKEYLIKNLKSNMDRFIVVQNLCRVLLDCI